MMISCMHAIASFKNFKFELFDTMKNVTDATVENILEYLKPIK